MGAYLSETLLWVGLIGGEGLFERGGLIESLRCQYEIACREAKINVPFYKVALLLLMELSLLKFSRLSMYCIYNISSSLELMTNVPASLRMSSFLMNYDIRSQSRIFEFS